ncbi:ankyrin repeat domain-containing protein [Stutzerimonas tarimensis]|uniref:Ankyrin repeat domain-containing protein n=1 Tax=Stutzerimonas tarimensis TaxID=1507735 RepID=A0ABV7T7A7_9GAMM
MKTLIFICALLVTGLSHAGAAGTEGPSVEQQLRGYLLHAARTGDQAMLEEFIGAGFDLNVTDAKGYTALILAAYHGHRDSVERLLEAGADPCIQDLQGNTALMGAIFKGEIRIARRLMSAACSPDQRNANGQTAAMYAALFQRAELLEALREQGADLTLTDRLGNSVERLARGELNGLARP